MNLFIANVAEWTFETATFMILNFVQDTQYAFVAMNLKLH